MAQLNFVVGDLAGNARRIIEAARQAHAQGARLLLTPELALAGYAAEDLYLRPAFIDACDDALHTVARETAGLKGLHIVVGHPARAASGSRQRSVAVAERAGFRFEGVLRQHLWLQGQAHDAACYSLLAIEWAARQPAQP